MNNDKKKKSDALLHAVLIGFLIGIVLYSVFMNSVGWFTLIPLWLIYLLTRKKDKEDS